MAAPEARAEAGRVSTGRPRTAPAPGGFSVLRGARSRVPPPLRDARHLRSGPQAAPRAKGRLRHLRGSAARRRGGARPRPRARGTGEGRAERAPRARPASDGASSRRRGAGSSEGGESVDGVAAPPRPRRGYSVGTRRDAAAATSWIFRGDAPPRPRGYSAGTSRGRDAPDRPRGRPQVLNNLLENREMALEDGSFLTPRATTGPRLRRVDGDFWVVALGLPTPRYPGNPLDPPLRSRFAAFSVASTPPDDEFRLLREAAPAAPPETLRTFVEVATALRRETGDDRPPRVPELGLVSAARLLEAFPETPPLEAFHRCWPWTAFELSKGAKDLVETTTPRLAPNDDGVDAMSVKELREKIQKAGLSSKDCREKSELRARAKEATRKSAGKKRPVVVPPSPYFSPRLCSVKTSRGGAAAATRMFRGNQRAPQVRLGARRRRRRALQSRPAAARADGAAASRHVRKPGAEPAPRRRRARDGPLPRRRRVQRQSGPALLRPSRGGQCQLRCVLQEDDASMCKTIENGNRHAGV